MRLLLTGGCGFIGSAVVRRAETSGRHEIVNIDKLTYAASVKAICALLDARLPSRAGARERLIRFVQDRPGHDNRYEIDPSCAEAALDWRAAHDFERGLAATIDWYLHNQDWWEGIRAQQYHGQRLGMTA